jgi:hypothetical protein
LLDCEDGKRQNARIAPTNSAIIIAGISTIGLNILSAVCRNIPLFAILLFLLLCKNFFRGNSEGGGGEGVREWIYLGETGPRGMEKTTFSEGITCNHCLELTGNGNQLLLPTKGGSSPLFLCCVVGRLNIIIASNKPKYDAFSTST